MQSLQCGAFLVECPADGGGLGGIAEIGLRSRHGEDRSPYSGFIHETQMVFQRPFRYREPFIHLHAVGFDGRQVRIGYHVTVHIDLADAGECVERKSHN